MWPSCTGYTFSSLCREISVRTYRTARALPSFLVVLLGLFAAEDISLDEDPCVLLDMPDCSNTRLSIHGI